MIKITSTLFVHRPERLVFYLPETTQEINQKVLAGDVPSSLEKYQYEYGTYDSVGIFYLPPDLKSKLGKDYLVGIEYRSNDKTLNLPKSLPCVLLDSCSLIIQDVIYDDQLTNELLDEIVFHAKKEKNARDGQYRYVEDGLVSVFVGKEKIRIMYEIELINATQKIKSNYKDYSKEELYQKAYHEGITNYYNWTWMWERFTTYPLDGIKDYAFVHFDIKDFKMINELYNHQVANNLLIQIAQNIEKHKDWIYYGARCDNDNFSLMVHGLKEDELKEKLANFFEEISQLKEDPSYRIYYRCGVVSMFYSMNSGDIVADCAKIAQATGTEINCTEINFYTKEMHEKVLWGKHLKAYLNTAIKGDELLVYLQPKINIEAETIYGAEALIRWDYKHKGLMPPYRFIPYFEIDDSIIKIDEFVLHQVCKELKKWKEKGYALRPISVNLSRKHMEHPNLSEQLTKIVDSYGVEHSLIEFELTESAAYDNQKYMISVLHNLKNKGFMISMDDFGTGYSSFGLLKEMPLDTLKIDKSFVDLVAIEENPNKNKIILHHIISMAKEMGIHCIAEGAEKAEQINALKELGCKTVQGFFYSKPIPMEQFEEKYMRK